MISKDNCRVQMEQRKTRNKDIELYMIKKLENWLASKEQISYDKIK